MAITTLAQYLAASKQRVRWIKTASRTATALQPISVFDLAGSPGAGTLAIDWATHQSGLVPTEADAGYPSLAPFAGGAAGCISRVDYSGTVACWVDLYDRLYVVGTFGGTTQSYAVSSPPSYASRVPGGTDFNGLQLFVESVAVGCPLYFTVTYTNQDGTTGCTSGPIVTAAALAVGGCLPIPLAPGDTGIQAIESFTFNGVSDTFESDTIGNLPSGWTEYNGAGAFTVQSIASQNAIRSSHTYASTFDITRDAPLLKDWDVYFDFYTESGIANCAGLLVRVSGSYAARNLYLFRFDFGSGWVYISKLVAGSQTDLTADGWTHAAATWYTARVQVIGTALKVKVWARGDAEPGTWLREITDSSVAGPGAIGLETFYGDDIVWFDNFRTVNAQCNLMVLRPLWSGVVRVANSGDIHRHLRTGMVQVFADSALYGLITPVGSASGIPTMTIEVASG